MYSERNEQGFRAIDVEETLKHINWFTEKAPNRISGTGDDRVAANYIVGKLREYGWDAGIYEFFTYNSRVGKSSLKICSPVDISIKSKPCVHVESTPSGGTRGELLYVGAGAESDYEGKDVRGKFVMVEVSYAPATPEKARIASRRGALGIICMTWGEAQHEAISMRGLKAVWGNPTETTFYDIPKVAGVSISRRDGEYLRDLCAKHESVVINLDCQGERLWESLAQPYGYLKGKDDSQEFVLVSAHLDAWFPGVTCNAGGDSVLLELARVLALMKNQLKRSVRVVFWNGHEIAEAAGSTWFCDHFWDDIRDHCVGYVNIDQVGMRGATKWKARASREVIDFVSEEIQKVLNITPEVTPLGKVGDQSFKGLGIPAILGRVSFDEEVIARNYGATLGWWNHTERDSLDKIDPENLLIDLRMHYSIIEGLANADILPLDFFPVCEDIKKKINNLVEGGFSDIDVKPISWCVDQLQQVVLRLNKEIGKKDAWSDLQRKEINETLKDLGRILINAFYTCASPYEQDSYGFTSLSKPIPLLWKLEELGKMNKESQEYYLLYTTLIRNRNRISDALHYGYWRVQQGLRNVGVHVA